MPTLTPQDAAAIRELATTAADADGVAPLSEATLLALAGDDPHDTHWLTPRSRGGMAAYAHLRVEDDGSAWAELVVHPDERRAGLGEQFLGEVREAAPEVRCWAHGDLPPARALAAKAGLQPVRTLLVLSRRDVPAIEDPVAPEGFSVRPFTEADADDWLAVNARAFAHHPEQGRLTRADLDQRIAQPWFDPAGLLLVRDDATGALAASHWTKVADPGSGVGEVYVVAVDPAYQGRGLGRFVTRIGLAHLRDRGVREIELYVEGDNAPALATYRREGFTERERHVMYAAGSSLTP
ncbi:mycothiol synthase [Calidifontibacter sp. DB0510]|uniref:Mycothiol acetyltransferase n=1 Tax=Metallococcus carri TaxID=1656884 RepID=A0A967E8R1_9MICO|nr:mycothiol synthase [Metallococcus carri]NHN55502.1 mycothiol synthase [Metallococcus carri]NOP38314.1 mycothiol synthase [Calidifontibacter sp. DB2511S]